MNHAHPGAAALRSLRSYLNPDVGGDPETFRDIGQHLMAGRLIVVRDAFRPAFAERLHACLDASPDWELHQDYGHPHFHYHHHNLYDERRFAADLRLFVEILRSAETKEFVQGLTGRDCSGRGEFSASWYRPGDHSLPHTDLVGAGTQDCRQVAMVWHLTRDWQPGWGGDFYWCQAGRYLSPSFNTLLLFTVNRESAHFVTTVSPHATGKRLAINGWWTGSSGTEHCGDAPEAHTTVGRLVEVI